METESAVPTTPVQTVLLGRDYEVVMPPLFTPKSGSAPLHPLNSKWCLWAQRKGKRTVGASWYEGYACIGRFDTVEGFWQLYSHLSRPEMVQGSADLMLFRDGIRPVWEDEANKGGGKWTVRMKKSGASLVWEELLLSLVGETLDGCSDICGAIISLRFQDNNISLWHRSADSEHFTSRLRESLTRTLRLPSSMALEYSRHKGDKRPAPSEGAGGAGFGAFGNRDGTEGGDGSGQQHGAPYHSHHHHHSNSHGNHHGGHHGSGSSGRTGYSGSSYTAGAGGGAGRSHHQGSGSGGSYGSSSSGSGSGAGSGAGNSSGSYSNSNSGGDRLATERVHGEMTKLSLRGGSGSGSSSSGSSGAAAAAAGGQAGRTGAGPAAAGTGSSSSSSSQRARSGSGAEGGPVAGGGVAAAIAAAVGSSGSAAKSPSKHSAAPGGNKAGSARAKEDDDGWETVGR